MGMREYAMYECVIPEEKVKETCPSEHEAIVKEMEVFDISFTDVAQVEMYQDFDELADEIDAGAAVSIFGGEADDAVMEAVSHIEKLYNELCDSFQNKTNLWLQLTKPDGNSTCDYDHLWTIPIKFSRKLDELGARIESWTEWG